MSINIRNHVSKPPKQVRTVLAMGMLSALCAAPISAAASRQQGRVAYVVDADTFRLDDGTRIRIAAIDAAETRLGQAKCVREIETGKAATNMSET